MAAAPGGKYTDSLVVARGCGRRECDATTTGSGRHPGKARRLRTRRSSRVARCVSRITPKGVSTHRVRSRR